MSDAMAIDSVGGGGGSGQPQQQQPMQRRQSMTEDEQKERRASIQAIMKDPGLTPQERRKSIQALMDGRRRSSTASLGGGGGMASAAAAAAAAYYDSSDESDSDTDMRGSSSLGSSLASGAADGHPGGAVGSRRQRSSLRSSFIDGVAAMNTGAGPGGDDGTASAASSGRSLFNSERRGSHLSSASSVDPSSGHHLGSAIGSSRKMEKTRPHCDHYERKCTIVSPCCGLAFGCRICHDDCPVLPPPIFSGQGGAAAMAEDDDDAGGTAADGAGAGAGHDSDSGLHGGDGAPKRRIGRSASMPSAFTEEETHHDIDRFAIREVICRDCYCRQSSKT